MTKAKNNLITSLKNIPIDTIESSLSQFESLIYVSVVKQRLYASISESENVYQYPVSTARNGIGSKQGSNQTPPGLHRITRVIGKTAQKGAIFVSRRKTGKVWNGEKTNEDLILSRILRLEGLEAGVNKGEGIDSFKRYIYIHGTNHEEQIGSPASHGCIRMKNNDIIELSRLVREGTLVYIN